LSFFLTTTGAFAGFIWDRKEDVLYRQVRWQCDTSAPSKTLLLGFELLFELFHLFVKSLVSDDYFELIQ